MHKNVECIIILFLFFMVVGVKRQSGCLRLSWQPMVEFWACFVTAISPTWFKRLSGWSHLSFRSFFHSPPHCPFLTATCSQAIKTRTGKSAETVQEFTGSSETALKLQ